MPAGALGVEDQLVQSDGSSQSARNSFEADVPGPIEWVYFADTLARRSLFSMQHSADHGIVSQRVAHVARVIH